MPKYSWAITAVQRLADLDIRQAARFMEDLSDKSAGEVLTGLPQRSAINCLEKMQSVRGAGVLSVISPLKAAEYLGALSPSDAAGIFRAMDPESRASVLEGVSVERKEDLLEHLKFPVNSAGQLMTTSIVSFTSGMKVREAVRHLRRLSKKQRAGTYAYVVDAERKINGVVTMRDLLLASSNVLVDSIPPNPQEYF